MNINQALKDFTTNSVFDYYADELEGKVIAIFNKDWNQIEQTISGQSNYLVLDKTCIYANSGGQESDKAYILSSDSKFDVLSGLKAPNGQHLIEIKPDQNQIKVGDVVKSVCDKEAKFIISCNHTGEHIVQGALRALLDKNIKQMGVNLTHNSLTVNFEWKEKLTDIQLQQIEDYVNDVIAKAIPVNIYFKTLDEAVAMGAVAKFDEVYSKIKGLLRIVEIKDVYTVLCAGRQASSTKDLEQFHIIKYASKGSNVWRIDGITTNVLTNRYIEGINQYINDKIDNIKKLFVENKYSNDNFIKSLGQIQLSNEWKQTLANQKLIDKLFVDANKLIEIFKNQQMNETINNIVDTINVENKKYVYIQLDNQPSNILNTLGNKLINKYQTTGFVITNIVGQKISYAIIKHPLANVDKPNELIKQINTLVNGRGGGKDNQVQGSCPFDQTNLEKIKDLVSKI